MGMDAVQVALLNQVTIARIIILKEKVFAHLFQYAVMVISLSL